MKVLLVGKGGREHALAYRIAQSGSLTSLAVMGHNPGWPEGVTEYPEGDVAHTVTLAQELGVDLVVAGPEAPLAAGLADALEGAGIPCFGPKQAAARLESSKAFAKQIMNEAGVATAACLVVDRRVEGDLERARARCAEGAVVLKADGLAAGKGVFVCETAAEALEALDELWGDRFGGASDRLVLEELMTGPEVSVFGLSDGTRVVPLISAQDHKRLGDGDVGPNTGGMGAYAPCPLIDAEQALEVVRTVHQPVVDVMREAGKPFRGVLYAGLMMTPDGPRLLEFNVRFGDPECQALMALWQDDILPWLHGAAVGQLPEGLPEFADGAACCVVLASAGYPLTSTKGTPIPEPAATPGVVAFHAGTRRDDAGVLRTNGGRVLGITGVGDTLREARDQAYAAVDGWRFDGAQVRGDIGWRALS